MIFEEISHEEHTLLSDYNKHTNKDFVDFDTYKILVGYLLNHTYTRGLMVRGNKDGGTLSYKGKTYTYKKYDDGVYGFDEKTPIKEIIENGKEDEEFDTTINNKDYRVLREIINDLAGMQKRVYSVSDDWYDPKEMDKALDYIDKARKLLNVVIRKRQVFK